MKLFHPIQDAAGGAVDWFFLATPRAGRYFLPPRQVARERYLQEIAFYMDQGFTEDPARFFQKKTPLPRHGVSDERPFGEGVSQVITWPSQYQVQNPLVEDQYLSQEKNKTAYLVRWTHGDRPRDTVLCLHGFMLGDPRQARSMFRIRKLFEAGMDVALFIAPFHWKRAPGAKHTRRISIQPDHPAHTAEFFGQAICDLTDAMAVLQDLETNRIGVIGASLGGYLAGILAGLSGVPAFASLVVPAVSFVEPMGPEGFKLPFKLSRPEWDMVGKVWRFHSPLNLSPRLAVDNIQVIGAQGDRLCPFSYTQKLCDKWGLTQTLFLHGGHWLQFQSKERGRAWYGFLQKQGFLKAA